MTWCSAFNFFFPKLFDLKKWFLARFFSSNLWCKVCACVFRGLVAALLIAFCVKGSVERSLLPSAIFLIFTRNRSWKSDDHLCTLFFIEMSKERLEKSERTPPVQVSWCTWALVYSRDPPYNFSCLPAMSKNGVFAVFFSAFGVSFGE